MVGDLFGFKALENTVDKVIDFTKEWTEKPESAKDISGVSIQVVEKLSNTPGMTQSRGTKFKKATPMFKLKDGTIIKTYRNSTGFNYVFLADANQRMIFGGYVNWFYCDNLKATISEIKTTFAATANAADTTQTAQKSWWQDILSR